MKALFFRAAQSGRPNPKAFLLNAHCVGLVEKILGSSLSPSTHQLHLGHMHS